MAMHVWTNDNCWIAGETLEQAHHAFADDYDQDELDADDWRQLPDDSMLSIYTDDNGEQCDCRKNLDEQSDYNILPNGHVETCPVGNPRKTCAQWAAEQGPGFLCSTEY